MRMFDLPYNGDDPKVFLERMEPYKEHIDAVFCSLPNTRHHLKSSKGVEYLEQCKHFLRESEGKVTRAVTLNTMYDVLNNDDMALEFYHIRNDIEEYRPDVCIISDFHVAQMVRNEFPDMKIDTSSNCFQYNIAEMKQWDKVIGIHYFNPPRQAARSMDMLKLMHSHGFKLKVLVNEKCFFGCPQMINHCIQLSAGSIRKDPCFLWEPENLFKGCWLLPRWLEKLDPYVAVWKIQGREASSDVLFKALDVYVNSAECYIHDLTWIDHQEFDIEHLEVPTDAIPDKLLTCKMEECDTCGVCKGLAEKFLKPAMMQSKNIAFGHGFSFGEQ